MSLQKNSDTELFGSMPMLPLMLRMALPSILAQLVNMLYSMVDRIYIGHITGVGTKALAGVGVCNTVIILISAFAQFTGGGGAPLAAIELGRGNRDKAEKMMGNGCFLLLILTVLLMVPVYLFLDPILYATGASAGTIGYAESYLSIYLVGTPAVMLTIGLNPFINAQGHPGTAMISVLIGAALNIVLDPVFIFAFGMGVSGAALATVISQTVSALWILSFLLSKKAKLRLRKRNLCPEGTLLRQIAALGVSPFVMASTESIIGLVMNRGLAAYGDIYVSALTIMQSCMQIYSVPLNGFTQGASPVVSYNYGHGNKKRVREGFHVIFAVMTAVNLAMTLWMILQPGFFAGIFTSDPELRGTVGRIMPVFLAGMTVFGMQRACQTMFIALNQPGVSLFIALLRKIFLLVPLALILPHWFGVMGIYGAEAVADALAACCCILIFLNRFPKILRGMSGDRPKEN